MLTWTAFDRGGHFPAMEVPQLLVSDCVYVCGCVLCVHVRVFVWLCVCVVSGGYFPGMEVPQL